MHSSPRRAHTDAVATPSETPVTEAPATPSEPTAQAASEDTTSSLDSDSSEYSESYPTDGEYGDDESDEAKRVVRMLSVGQPVSQAPACLRAVVLGFKYHP